MRSHFFMAVGLMLLGGCGAMCENEISQTVVSPSGNMKAVVFHRGCGATVGFNTQVSLLPASARLPNDGGNVLIVDGSVPLKVEWKSDAAVLITGQLNTRMFKQQSSVAGVQVAYAN
jgi:hypothetical protein